MDKQCDCPACRLRAWFQEQKPHADAPMIAELVFEIMQEELGDDLMLHVQMHKMEEVIH